MGNGLSDRSCISEKSQSAKERTNKIVFLLHRTWAIIVAEKWTKSRTSKASNTNDLNSDLESQYSFCSCSQCHRNDANSDVSSEIFSTESNMPPNSEDGARINNFSWTEECIAKEKQRPPIYNPEDYALSLKKWGRKPPPNGPGLYSNATVVSVDPEKSRTKSHSFRDYRNPMLSENEMTLRQFGTISELLCKLKSDLKLSYASLRLPSTVRRMADCACDKPGGGQAAAAPARDGCVPCSIPTFPAGTPLTVVNPCPPHPMECTCACCNVVVPVCTMTEQQPAPVRKRCRYIQPERPKSFKPDRVFKPPACPMADGTVYKRSYLPVDGDRPGLVLPTHNICLGEGRISDDTIHKMSYQGHKNVLPPCPILPCEHQLLGEGPMQDITTQKHDYVPKPYSRMQSIHPINNIFSSDCPISDLTTNKLSYMPVDVKNAHVNPVIPVNAIPMASGKFSECTVHRMSFLPWETQEKMDMPWAKKQNFVPPTTRMEGCTVQKMSYGPPGTYVECNDDCPDCVECPQLDCHTSIPRHQPQNCCAPCCCPRAAC